MDNVYRWGKANWGNIPRGIKAIQTRLQNLNSILLLENRSLLNTSWRPILILSSSKKNYGGHKGLNPTGCNMVTKTLNIFILKHLKDTERYSGSFSHLLQ
jgi:hypothetical protein